MTPTSNRVTSSLTVPVVQPWELQRTTARLLSRDSVPRFVNLVVSSINSSQTLYGQPVRESWSSAWNVILNTTPVEQVQHFDSGKEMVKALRQVVS